MFIVLQDWMMNALMLKGCDLLVYATIYGYSQSQQGSFHGSAGYLAECLNVSRQSIVTSLKTLTERELLNKQEAIINGVKVCSYMATPVSVAEICKETLQGVKKFDREGKKTLQGGCKEILHNNKDIDNKKDNKDNIPLTPLPYDSEEFRSTWAILVKQPKWRNKSKDALAAQAKFLAGYPEGVAIKIMNNSIRNGWQGLFALKAEDEKQQKERLVNAVGRVRASVLRQLKEMGLTRQEILEGYGEDYAEEMDKYGHLI